MKKKINIGLIGYGNWGKKIFRNLKYFSNTRVYIFKKKNNNNKNFNYLKKFSELTNYNFDAIISATNYKVHSKLCLFCIKNNLPVFLEKPLTKNINLFKQIEQTKNYKKNIVHINYIYKRYIEYLKIKNKKKIKKIVLVMGSPSNNNLYNDNLWDWAPHVLSVLFYLNKSKLINISIKKKFKNFFLKCQFKNKMIALCYFGNNFKKSCKKINFLYAKGKTTIDFNKVNKIENSPLFISLKQFFDDIYKANNNITDLSLTKKITNVIIKLKK